jgi:hypothetical protein
MPPYDHIGIVGTDLFVQELGGARQQVPVLVHRAAPHRRAFPDGSDRFLEPRCAVDDEELGAAQATDDEIDVDVDVQ